MTLYIVGGGLSSEYITLKAVNILSRVNKVYVDTYTSIAPGIDSNLVRRINPWAEVVEATRTMLEENSHIIVEEAAKKDVAVLVPGDPFTATTHVALAVEALRRGVRVEVVPGIAGPYAAALLAGLQSYRIGKMVTLVYPEQGYKPYSTVETVWENLERNLHTILLLDLRLDESRAMTIPEAVKIILELEEELLAQRKPKHLIRDSLLVGVARAGLEDYKCVAGKPRHLLDEEWPPPPHTIIVVAPKPHPMELEALETLCVCKACKTGKQL